jgi:hypothetical protein
MKPLRALGLTLEPDGAGRYVVYSGHAGNLHARAREHLNGHPKTGCLALQQYSGLHSFAWEYRFAALPDWVAHNGGNRALRSIGEQLWRAHHGWPLLCTE